MTISLDTFMHHIYLPDNNKPKHHIFVKLVNSGNTKLTHESRCRNTERKPTLLFSDKVRILSKSARIILEYFKLN